MLARLGPLTLARRWVMTTPSCLSAAKARPVPSAPAAESPAEPARLPLTTTKGRKAPRKSRRATIHVPESFVSTNLIYHAAIPLEDFCPSYNSIIPGYLWEEITHSVRAGLVPKGPMATFNHSDHLVLNVPGRGATFLQDAIARRLAAQVEADLLVFDPQDFILLAQEGHNSALTLLPLMSGRHQDSTAVLAIQPNMTMRSNLDEEEAEALEEEEEEPIKEHEDREKKKLLRFKGLVDQMLHNEQPDELVPQVMTEMKRRYAALFEKILQTNKEKDAQNRPKLIYLRDYGDMHDVFGSLMLKALMTAVEGLKQKGHALVIVAGSSPSLRQQERTYQDAVDLENLPLMTGMKCLSVPPPLYNTTLLRAWETQLARDAARRVGEINARQILAVYNHKNVIGFKTADNKQELCLQLMELDGIRDSIWIMEEVERRVTTALGIALQQKKTRVEIQDFMSANRIVRQGVSIHKEAKRLLEQQRLHLGTDGGVDMDSLKGKCDDYESRLLTRIVDPTKVQCTFKDVRAPPLTVETLQTLITLPLVRPDLFQHGILKQNFISGVLLFGPPGTGKTMLAKAVAKESGSRMLEIQASDVYEMYVGEGEKNVKAIFSLARKLSPCVVFIDEVDSLMNKRRSEATSNAHREIINQFMVEWDGLTSDNQGVMVMAATNRPFDLDDAVLRRMPRRILVDLPKEEDRAAIIQRLLQDEQHDLSVAELARATEHYSGSDLKNLCVTAALRAVQQQVATKEKQRLNWSHVSEALKMVPASSSEDMGSLVEIRKWAEKFGDGDKKKKTVLGFS